jgi:putative mRNA 3-end processing factor
VVATPVTCDLLKHRLAEPGEAGAPADPAAGAEGSPIAAAAEGIATRLIPVRYGEGHREEGLTIELFPAGHVLGSAMARVMTPRGRLLYTGDFRFRDDALTVPACELPAEGADVVLMECTYGLERYRFPTRARVIEQLCDTVAAAFAEGRQPVCLCYSLGKAQEIGRSLLANGFRVTMHGAAYEITRIYREHGAEGLEGVRRYEAGAIEGTVLIAPPHIRNSRMITGIANAHISVVTGWSLDSSTLYRYKAHAVFPISDHADFDELNAFVDAMRERGARHFLLTHGFVKPFCSHLRGRGVSAGPARPPPQMTLFDD